MADMILYPWGLAAILTGHPGNRGLSPGGQLPPPYEDESPDWGRPFFWDWHIKIALVNTDYVYSDHHCFFKEAGGSSKSPWECEISHASYSRKIFEVDTDEPVDYPVFGLNDVDSAAAYAYISHPTANTGIQWDNLHADCGEISGAVLFFQVPDENMDETSVLFGYVPFSYTPDSTGYLKLSWSDVSGILLKLFAKELN